MSCVVVPVVPVVASGWAAVAAPAVLSVPMSTVSASSHLSALRMHPPLELHSCPPEPSGATGVTPEGLEGIL